MFFRLRAHLLDLCFELAQLLSERLKPWRARVVDEVHGFRSFDERDLLGFVDEHGVQHQIMRFNMPFGRVRTPDVVEEMLETMFIGRPHGNTDRILDFPTAFTANLFFVPTVGLLDDPPTRAPAAVRRADAAPESNGGSLAIGSLSGRSPKERLTPALAARKLGRLLRPTRLAALGTNLGRRVLPLLELRDADRGADDTDLEPLDEATSLGDRHDRARRLPAARDLRKFLDGPIVWTPGVTGAIVSARDAATQARTCRRR